MSSTRSRQSIRSMGSRMNNEEKMARQRERQHDHQVKWGNQVRYYQTFERSNQKYEEWTSPRYYRSNNRLIDDSQRKLKKQEQLERRREKLKKLYDDENRSYEIEVHVRNRKNYPQKSKCAYEAMPTKLLKEVNIGIKQAEEEKRKHEAELQLYHHWRDNNPVLKHYERNRLAKDVKLSWLDQQIEKRIAKQQAEEECRKVLSERNKRLEEAKQREMDLKQEIERKNRELKEDLEKQIGQLKIKQKESEELQAREDEERRKLRELSDMERQLQETSRKKKDRETALQNLRHHKMRLKQKAIEVQEDLEEQRQFVKRLMDSEMAERLEDVTKKEEIKRAMHEFAGFVRDQQALEKERQKHFDFVFDSEAKLICERQEQTWREEEKAREKLLEDVLGTIKRQIDEKVKCNEENQKELLEERQQTLKTIEDYDKDIQSNLKTERQLREEWKCQIEEQLREKEARKRVAQLHEEKEIDLKLEATRREEERLRHEIMELQRRQLPIRHTRSRIVF